MAYNIIGSEQEQILLTPKTSTTLCLDKDVYGNGGFFPHCIVSNNVDSGFRITFVREQNTTTQNAMETEIDLAWQNEGTLQETDISAIEKEQMREVAMFMMTAWLGKWRQDTRELHAALTNALVAVAKELRPVERRELLASKRLFDRKELSYFATMQCISKIVHLNEFRDRVRERQRLADPEDAARKVAVDQRNLEKELKMGDGRDEERLAQVPLRKARLAVAVVSFDQQWEKLMSILSPDCVTELKKSHSSENNGWHFFHDTEMQANLLRVRIEEIVEDGAVKERREAEKAAEERKDVEEREERKKMEEEEDQKEREERKKKEEEDDKKEREKRKKKEEEDDKKEREDRKKKEEEDDKKERDERKKKRQEEIETDNLDRQERQRTKRDEIEEDKLDREERLRIKRDEIEEDDRDRKRRIDLKWAEIAEEDKEREERKKRLREEMEDVAGIGRILAKNDRSRSLKRGVQRDVEDAEESDGIKNNRARSLKRGVQKDVEDAEESDDIMIISTRSKTREREELKAREAEIAAKGARSLKKGGKEHHVGQKKAKEADGVVGKKVAASTLKRSHAQGGKPIKVEEDGGYEDGSTSKKRGRKDEKSDGQKKVAEESGSSKTEGDADAVSSRSTGGTYTEAPRRSERVPNQKKHLDADPSKNTYH